MIIQCVHYNYVQVKVKNPQSRWGHTIWAVHHSPTLTEVILFGGGDRGSYVSNTTVLQFGESTLCLSGFHLRFLFWGEELMVNFLTAPTLVCTLYWHVINLLEILANGS